MSISLSMIVKNEAHVIAACLASVRPHIDHWIVLDTGSTDETERVVRESLIGIPGEFRRTSWHGFGAARTEAFAHALAGGREYALVIDADETLHVEGSLQELTADAYAIWAIPSATTKSRTHRLFKLDRLWRYEGVVHEYPTCDLEWDENATLEGVTLQTTQNGARSLDPEKYRRDAMILGDAVAADPSNARNVFYLAQSWRDAGDDERAVPFYLRRAKMGPGLNWEEVYISLVEAGRALGRLHRLSEAEEVLIAARRAWPARPEAMALLAELFTFLARNTPPTGTVAVETCHYHPD